MTAALKTDPRLRWVAAEALVVGFCIAAACAWWWPLPLHLLDGQLEGPPLDSAYNQWLLGWGSHALTTDPLHYFDANAYHPHSGVLAWGDHLFALAMLMVPLRAAFGLVGGYNLLVLASTAASAYTCYLLIRLLTGRRAISALAGVLWSCSFYRVLEYAHIQTLSTYAIPLVFFFAEHIRRRCRTRHVIGLAVSGWFVLATNVYLGVYTVLSFAVYALVVVLLRRHPDLRTVVRLGSAWLIAGVLALPLYLPGIRLQAARDIVRTIDDQSPATLDAFRLLPPPGQLAQIVSDRFGERLVYRGNYATPGVVLLLLLVLGLVLHVRRADRDPERWRVSMAFGAVALVALVSAQGPKLQWYGREVVANPVFLAAYHLVPGYDALRIPHRWLLFASLGLVVLTATLVAPLLDRIPAPARVALVIGLAAITIVEQSPSPFPIHPGYSTDDEPVYAWLQDQPRHGTEVILELPISADIAGAVTQELEAKRLYFSAFHFRDRVGGGISPYIEPTYMQNALIANEVGRDPGAIEALRRWDVDLVIFDESDQARYEGAEAPADVLARLDAESGLRRIARRGDATVYRVERR